MNKRKFLVLLLIANLIAAVACQWQPANRTLVIINALAVFVLVIRKAARGKD